MSTATFTKHQGQWAIKGQSLHLGDGVAVIKRDGTVKQVKVTAILSDRNGEQVCTFSDVSQRGHVNRVQRRSTRTSAGRVDHEDCLSFGGCLHNSPRCPYHR